MLPAENNDRGGLKGRPTDDCKDWGKQSLSRLQGFARILYEDPPYACFLGGKLLGFLPRGTYAGAVQKSR
jgi:hypothetical protein